MHRVVMVTLLLGWLAPLAGVGHAQPGPEPAGAIQDADREPGLPDGTIRKGTLANAKLIHDAHDGVFVQAVLMELARPEKEEMYVVQDPAGLPGAQCWREKWFLTDEKGAMGSFDMLFMEDGNGGATWVIEDSAKVPGAVIKRTGDGERAAAMRELNQLALDAVVNADAERYIATAKAFVRYAKKGDVHQMMKVTSPLTLAKHGLGEIHETYSKNYLPRFKNSTVEWDEEFVLMSDETGNRGIEVSGTLKGKKTHRIYVWVMREGGKHVVIGIGTKRQAELAPPPDELPPAPAGERRI
jgi:hypothetical protein